MYDLIDQPRKRLCAGSDIILSAMRTWVASVTHHQCPQPALANCFPQQTTPPILHDFHALMASIHWEGQRPMVFGLPCHPLITETEAILLSLWADIAAGRSENARSVLRLIVSQIAIDAIFSRISSVAAHLTASGCPPSPSLSSRQFLRGDTARRP